MEPAWVSALAKEELPDDLTPSICEAALDRFRDSDDSLAGIIEQHHIQVRDFMALSLICDQEELGVDQLTRALGLSIESVIDCAERMMGAGLVQLNTDNGLLLDNCRIRSTAAGRLLTQKILDNVG
jgi:hypothetical protein